MKVIICVVLLVLGAAVKAQEGDANPDYFANDYDALYDSYVDTSDENTDLKQVDASKSVETDDVQQDPDTQPLPAADDGADPAADSNAIPDYQIEDNRSKEQVEDNQELPAEEEKVEDKSLEEHKVLPLGAPEPDNEEYPDFEADNPLWRDAVADIADDVDPLPVPEAENDEEIFKETEDILNNDKDSLDEEKVPEETAASEKNIDNIIEETNKLLAEMSDEFDNKDFDTSQEQDQEKSEEDIFNEKPEDSEEDTPAKVYADLNADLDKLIETFNKLSEDVSNEDKENEDLDKVLSEAVDQEPEDPKQADEPLDAFVADDDIAADEDIDADEDIEADENIVDDEQKDDEQKDDELFSDELGADENIVSTENKDDTDYVEIQDSNLSEIFAENEKDENKTESKEVDENVKQEKNTTMSPSPQEIEEEKKIIDYVDNYDELTDTEPNADDDIDSIIKQIFNEDVKEPQPYGDDGLVDEKRTENADAVVFETTTASVEDTTEQKTKMVDDLNSDELEQLRIQFIATHQEELDPNSESFAKNVAPIHITLSVDTPTVIESPNFPNPYEPNNIVDWILDGSGQGIELNITSLNLNSVVGDFLLIKPGGLDATGSDGIVFAHRLVSERKYRFTGVDRLFIRFQSNNIAAAWQTATGFSLSVKLMWPLPELVEELPDAEAVIEPPRETLTLNLAGLTLAQFKVIKDDFRLMLADMAKAYINDNNIELGLNTTYEVTQITRAAICNIQWPDYESCVEVTFGVPLQYDDEVEGSEPRLSTKELDDMWTTYIIKDNFAERLRSFGITEYAIPDDQTVLMVWLVIAAGVIISMAMLAFALWRFSCFEDYTRMKVYGDTDSVQNEKRHLDLYPTPHQTLPPLYSETDYKWADDKYDDSTRVDMGGFSNNSYVRDDLYEYDSDEDVITPRDRKGIISPRNYYDA
ncbi:uncharacterized protein LOC118279136 isoform X1 [Spodoptera frugiperda]|uniref:Uncharacterized protein LOC118279136 isoform X1 n=1 Tax=Spodoptera frugiperda TaxID=7108 RepID=A0A9R0DHY7_SPOFR|nr:uncharacterized protein LOC118279136 isoform X1 [Spodoptera frugiperda]